MFSGSTVTVHDDRAGYDEERYITLGLLQDIVIVVAHTNDSDVLDWFRRQGRGYQTQINALLRAYMEVHETEGPRRERRRTPRSE